MLLFLLLYIAALVLAGVAAFEARRGGPTLLIALAVACVALVGVLQTIPHV